MNFYVMDQRQGDAPDRAAGWSPTLEGDFHVPNRFGVVTFAGPTPDVVGAAEPAPGAPVIEPTVRLPAARAAALQEAMARRQLGATPPRPRN